VGTDPAHLLSRSRRRTCCSRRPFAEGRLNVAFTQGTSATDWRSFRPDAAKDEPPKIMAEGVELILRCWTEPGPWRHEGEYWTCESVGPNPPEHPERSR
jgi:alkanesulfonate monooxygenase SsuD/methylene tetrahydromethanopterin reductase-like flavin-dependent oxidoreductase (luciferase family)